MQKWEYIQGFYYFYEEKDILHGKHKKGVRLELLDETFEDENVLLRINELGRVGWELLAVTPLVGSIRGGTFVEALVAMDPIYKTATNGFYMWFKRPLPE